MKTEKRRKGLLAFLLCAALALAAAPLTLYSSADDLAVPARPENNPELMTGLTAASLVGGTGNAWSGTTSVSQNGGPSERFFYDGVNRKVSESPTMRLASNNQLVNVNDLTYVHKATISGSGLTADNPGLRRSFITIAKAGGYHVELGFLSTDTTNTVQPYLSVVSRATDAWSGATGAATNVDEDPKVAKQYTPLGETNTYVSRNFVMAAVRSKTQVRVQITTTSYDTEEVVVNLPADIGEYEPMFGVGNIHTNTAVTAMSFYWAEETKPTSLTVPAAPKANSALIGAGSAAASSDGLTVISSGKSFTASGSGSAYYFDAAARPLFSGTDGKAVIRTGVGTTGEVAPETLTYVLRANLTMGEFAGIAADGVYAATVILGKSATSELGVRIYRTVAGGETVDNCTLYFTNSADPTNEFSTTLDTIAVPGSVLAITAVLDASGSVSVLVGSDVFEADKPIDPLAPNVGIVTDAVSPSAPLAFAVADYYTTADLYQEEWSFAAPANEADHTIFPEGQKIGTSTAYVASSQGGEEGFYTGTGTNASTSNNNYSIAEVNQSGASFFADASRYNPYMGKAYDAAAADVAFRAKMVVNTFGANSTAATFMYLNLFTASGNTTTYARIQIFKSGDIGFYTAGQSDNAAKVVTPAEHKLYTVSGTNTTEMAGRIIDISAIRQGGLLTVVLIYDGNFYEIATRVPILDAIPRMVFGSSARNGTGIRSGSYKLYDIYLYDSPYMATEPPFEVPAATANMVPTIWYAAGDFTDYRGTAMGEGGTMAVFGGDVQPSFGDYYVDGTGTVVASEDQVIVYKFTIVKWTVKESFDIVFADSGAKSLALRFTADGEAVVRFAGGLRSDGGADEAALPDKFDFRFGDGTGVGTEPVLNVTAVIGGGKASVAVNNMAVVEDAGINAALKPLLSFTSDGAMFVASAPAAQCYVAGLTAHDLNADKKDGAFTVPFADDFGVAGVALGGETVDPSAYAYDGGALTFTAAYVRSLAVKRHAFTVTTDNGAFTLELNVSDTRTPPALTSGALAFDKSAPADVVLTLAMNGGVFDALRLDGAAVDAGDYTLDLAGDVGTLTLKAAYLAALPLGARAFVFETADASILALTVAVSDPRMPTAAASAASFDKGAAADVVFTIDLNGASFTALRLNGEAVAAGNYTHAGGTLTIKAAYLASLPYGGAAFSFVCSANGDELDGLPLAVAVGDSRSPVNVEAVSYNRAEGGDLALEINMYNAVFKGVSNGYAALTEGADYTYADGVLTVKASFLQAFAAGGAVTLTVYTNPGGGVADDALWFDISIEGAADPGTDPGTDPGATNPGDGEPVPVKAGCGCGSGAAALAALFIVGSALFVKRRG
ncbi:MAG: hypothetical protein LBL66_06560 [Clostridiales bacterium]|jgi:hypothetical protein|nr:hypothetical protein [Clostridiales bacterium]